MTKHQSFSLVFGLGMTGMFIYGIAVLINAATTGKLRVAMRGSATLEVLRRRNPLTFWIYYFLTFAGTIIAAFGAFYFLIRS
jgi:hypothetical protein